MPGVRGPVEFPVIRMMNVEVKVKSSHVSRSNSPTENGQPRNSGKTSLVSSCHHSAVGESRGADDKIVRAHGESLCGQLGPHACVKAGHC